MRTKQITIDEMTYTLAPLNYGQYEQTMVDEDGAPLKRARVGDAVAFSLANAKAEANPSMDEVPAGHVPKLLLAVLEVSGLQANRTGEAAAATAQG